MIASCNSQIQLHSSILSSHKCICWLLQFYVRTVIEFWLVLTNYISEVSNQQRKVNTAGVLRDEPDISGFNEPLSQPLDLETH